MKTLTLRHLRVGLLALAAVVAWGGAAAQDSPGASKGFDRYGRRIDHGDHDGYWRHDKHRRNRNDRYNDGNAWQRDRDHRDRDHRYDRHNRDRDRYDRGYYGGDRSGKSHPFVRDPGANGG